MVVKFYNDGSNWIYTDGVSPAEKATPAGMFERIVYGGVASIKSATSNHYLFKDIVITDIQKSATPDDNYASEAAFKTATSDFFVKASSSGGAELTSDAEFLAGLSTAKAPTAVQAKEYTDASVPTGTEMVAEIDVALGQTDWKNGAAIPVELLPLYDTKILLEASGEADAFSMVNNDIDNNNGLYAKVNGTWILMYDIRDPNIPIKKSINLVDQNNIVASSTIDAAGAVVASGTEYVSQPIPVKLDNYIIKTTAKRYRLLGADGVLLPVNATYYKDGVNTATDKVFIIHKDVKYIQTVGVTSALGVSDQVIQAYDATPNTSLGIPAGWADFDVYKRDFLLYEYYTNGIIVPLITSNIFKYRETNFAGAYTTGSLWTGGLSTPFMRIQPNIDYCTNNGIPNYFSWWDKDQVFISSSGKPENNTAKSPATAYYLTVGDGKSSFDLKNFKVVRGTYFVDSFVNKSVEPLYEHPFTYGGVLKIISDSLTAGSRSWLNRAAVALKAKDIDNYSSAGYRMSTYANNIDAGGTVTYNGTQYIIWLGTNDWRYNGLLGTIADTTTASFYGSMKVLTDTILTNDADAKILMATPIQRDLSDLFGDSNINTSGDALEDYRDAVVNFCHKNNLSCLDLYDWGGASPFYVNTQLNFFVAGDYTHLNTLGADIFLGYKFANFINSNV